jgi:hypothetical protein
MSLGKLLTSGKSLVGLHNPEGRYEMRTKNLLPKFGSEKNPFSTVKPQSLQPELVEKIPTIARSRTMTPAEIAAARLKETKRLPLVTAIKSPAAAAPGISFKTKALGWIREQLKRVNLRSWWPARKSRTVKSAAMPFGKAPVQAELSLDKVKVLRNDLSEGDLEVVPVKISMKVKSESVEQPAVLAEETAELIKT